MPGQSFSAERIFPYLLSKAWTLNGRSEIGTECSIVAPPYILKSATGPHSGVARGHILLSSSSGCIRQRILPNYPYTGNSGYDYCYHEDTKPRWGGLQIAAREQYAQILVNRILALCKSRGISVNKLSEMSGVSQSTLDNLVNGKTFNPRICTLHRIALAFGMTVSEFLNFKDLNDFSFEDILDD